MTTHTITVSMDGARRNACSDISFLGRHIAHHLDDLKGVVSDDFVEDLVRLYNEAAQSVSGLNCIFSNDIEHFSDLSDSVEPFFIEIDD